MMPALLSTTIGLPPLPVSVRSATFALSNVPERHALRGHLRFEFRHRRLDGDALARALQDILANREIDCAEAVAGERLRVQFPTDLKPALRNHRSETGDRSPRAGETARACSSFWQKRRPRKSVPSPWCNTRWHPRD